MNTLCCFKFAVAQVLKIESENIIMNLLNFFENFVRAPNFQEKNVNGANSLACFVPSLYALMMMVLIFCAVIQSKISSGVYFSFIEFWVFYWACRVLHELVHAVYACYTYKNFDSFNFQNIISILKGSHVEIPLVPGMQRPEFDCIRHAGWMGSLLIAVATTVCSRQTVHAASFLTLIDALCSDLFRIQSPSADNVFLCGNFGMVIMDHEHRDKAMAILRKMARISMMRGAQAGGVVTYAAHKGRRGHRALRVRLVPDKRSDLSKSLVARLQRAEYFASFRQRPDNIIRLYSAHTQRADACPPAVSRAQPARWTPALVCNVWSDHGGTWASERCAVEIHAAHDGELRAWTAAGQPRPPAELLPWLEAATHRRRPSDLPGACIAGILDLLRAQGSWFHAVRFGFHFGPERGTLDYAVPTRKEVPGACISWLFPRAPTPVTRGLGFRHARRFHPHLAQ